MAKAISSDGAFGPALAPGLRAGRGRYLLKRLVGRGEFSELWLARDVKEERDAALKFLPRAFLQDSNLLETIQGEIQRSRLLKHPHIVSAYELAADYDMLAIAMEFVNGWSLATLRVDKPNHAYTVEEIEPWIREICPALSYAHREFGMVHGDLKPSNLLASTREGIKISDFGLAVLVRNESSRRGIIKSGYGGIGFLSPQQVMGSAPTTLDDVYSLGATIFDLITGTPPFNKGEVIAQICSLTPPTMTERLKELGILGEAISPVWEETVAACLAKNPADRPGAMDEVLRWLQRQETVWTPPSPADWTPPALAERAASVPAAQTERAPTRPIPPGIQPAPVSRASRIPVIVAGVFIIAGLAVAFWFGRSVKWPALLSPHALESAKHPPGSLDGSFFPGTGAADAIRCIELLPDGKILAGGYFTDYNGATVKRIMRLNTEGGLDVSFAVQAPEAIFSLATLSDGHIFMGGGIMQGPRGFRRVIRVNPDGSLDDNFAGKSSYNRDLHVIVVQPDGKVLVGGSFNRVLNRRLGGLVRLNADGSPDTSFDIGGGASATVWSIAVQPDGKILAAGEFRKFHNQPKGHLVRLNPDGSFDTDFNDGTGADGNVMAVLLQKDGKILICGDFNEVNDSPFPHIARLKADGSLDGSFHPDGEMANELWTLAVQSDGRILVGGRNRENQEARPFLARLNPDGSRDASFQAREETTGAIWQLAVQPDGKILVAGNFTNFDGAASGNIVRLNE